jgi:hypothetical protein
VPVLPLPVIASGLADRPGMTPFRRSVRFSYALLIASEVSHARIAIIADCLEYDI